MKRVWLNVIFVFSLIFLISYISAVAPEVGKCAVVLRDECLASQGNNIILGMSSTTNAHAEYPDQGTYDYVLCCGFGFGNKTCSPLNDPDNKIIGLSSTTNAHAEIPSGINYNTINVCYEDLVCEKKTNNCAEDYSPILSLSSDTNAHVGNALAYPTKICCKGTSMLAATCTLESAEWSLEDATENNRVRLTVTANDPLACNNQALSFEVFEKDIGGGTSPVVHNPVNINFNSNGIATGFWTAEWQDDSAGILETNPPEYYFIAKLVKHPERTVTSSNPLLKVEKEDISDYCAAITTCEDYSSQTECEGDFSSCNVAESNLPDIDCDDASTICDCYWDTENDQCQFGFSMIESCGEPETGCTYGCTLCHSSLIGDYCNLESCPLGDSPTCNNDGVCDLGEGCSCTSDCVDGDQDTCSEDTYCISDMCASLENPITFAETGKCKITQEITKNCEEEPNVGSRVLTWNGIWTESGQEIIDAVNCNGDSCIKCVTGGSTTVACPAQISLPFFNVYTLILSLIIIALVYFLIISRKKNIFHRKKKR